MKDDKKTTTIYVHIPTLGACILATCCCVAICVAAFGYDGEALLASFIVGIAMSFYWASERVP